ncbi:MAG: hypothetical protein IPP78_11275 [Holophagaceae bacterium]|nr:hypothetical protein [Holophagaceae bacterium]
MMAGPKAGAPLLWNLGRDWKQIVLGIKDGGSETPDQPIGTDRENIPKTPEGIRQLRLRFVGRPRGRGNPVSPVA